MSLSPPRRGQALLAGMLAPGERPTTRVVHGRGVRLTLEDGREVIDAGSLSSCLIGHCHPAVVEAVQRAAETVYVNDTTGYAPREQAAEDLLRVGFADEPWADHVALFVSASEAADLGLLLAQTLTGRAPLVCRELAYHGAVGLSRAVSVHPLWSAQLAAIEDDEALSAPPSLAEVRRLPVPVCGLGAAPEGHECAITCLHGAEMTLDGAAAVIMDYSQGCVCPSPGYTDALATLAQQAGALWIADETVTGFGRMGHGFAFQRGTQRPQMVVLGKGLTGGATAAGALVLSSEVAERLQGRRWTTSSTFRGNPLAAAAISATMGVVAEEDLIARAAALGSALGRDVRELGHRHPCVKRVVGEGLMWLLQLDTPPHHTEAFWHGGGKDVTLPELVHRRALELGAYVGVQSGQSLWLVPPLTVNADELAQVVEALDTALVEADRILDAQAVSRS